MEDSVLCEICERLARIEEQNKTFFKRFDEVRGDIDAIKAKPEKRYDTLVSTVISGIVAAIIGYFVGNAGLK